MEDLDRVVGLGLYKGYVRVILGIYWVYIGIMKNKPETTIMGHIRFRVFSFWFWGARSRVPGYTAAM